MAITPIIMVGISIAGNLLFLPILFFITVWLIIVMSGTVVNVAEGGELAILITLFHQQAYIPGEELYREVVGAFREG